MELCDSLRTTNFKVFLSLFIINYFCVGLFIYVLHIFAILLLCSIRILSF